MWPWLLALLAKIPALLAGPVTQFFTGINVASVLGGTAKFFVSAWANIKKYWRFYLPTLLVVSELTSLYGWHETHNSLMKEKAAHQLEITNFKKAQADADAKAQAIKATLQKESKANADQADAQYSTLLAQYRANLVRYQASQSGSKRSSNYQFSPAQSGDGSGSGPDIYSGSLVISMDDAQICAVNTARLQAVHDWAIDPPKDGVQ